MIQRVAKLRRYYQTVRTLRWQQISNRIRRRLLPPRVRVVSGAKLRVVENWLPPISKARHLTEDGRLTIFGVSRDAWTQALWRNGSVPALWLYHAHYCDDVASDEVTNDEKQRLVSAWIEGNQTREGPGWDAYPISRRIVNWLKYYLQGGELNQDAIDSVATQVDYLSRNLEFHLLGNHLLANLKTLIFAGLVLDTPAADKWLAMGQQLLKEQLAEQILPDGGHHELSPMYHAVVLEDLLDLVNLSTGVSPGLRTDLEPLCASMLGWLSTMTHPDGGIALFNDAALNGCVSTATLYDYAKRLGIPAVRSEQEEGQLDRIQDLPQSGYVRIDRGSAALFADIAPIGPAHIPGHAHADTLSFELSVEGHRVVVNSGTSTYQNNAERHRQRSTGAHNTVVIDGKNSSDVWSTFRVGQRAAVQNRRVVEDPASYAASGRHDGFLKSAGVMHSRSFEVSDSELIIRDTLTGSGKHEIEWPLHLHPEIGVTESGAGLFTLKIPSSKSLVVVRFDERLQAQQLESTYHPGFGQNVTSTKLTAMASLELPCELTVTIRI